VQFEELLTLEPETLHDLNPYGVIFLFKYPTGASAETKDKSRPLDGEFDYAALEPATFSNNNDEDEEKQPLWFAAQTIQNACGTQALLSILLNQNPNPTTSPESQTSNPFTLGPTLTDFRDFTTPLPAEYRGEALSNSSQIRDVHNSFARSSPFISEESRAAGEDDDVYHFVAYTSINSTLYELDGLQPAPIRHGDEGACPREIFAEAVVPVLRRRIERYPVTEIRFNLLAVCEDLRLKARSVGDLEVLAREEGKRREWRWENSLRRHNFVGFIGEVLKGVVRDRVRKGGYGKWVEDAQGITRRRGKERRAMKGGSGGGEEMDIS